MKSCIGDLTITSKQAKQLKVRARTQISPHMEKCCLLSSGNESYERAMKNVKELTGITVSHSTQQRLVQRYNFPKVELAETVEEMSLDGGKVRLRTAKGQKVNGKITNLLPCKEKQ